MRVSGFIHVKAAALCSNLSKVIVVCFVPMVLSPALLFRKVKGRAAHNNAQLIAQAEAAIAQAAK